jgi:hydroxymethylpyrimidine pyrophosphatase-like HAD family hydrolase
MLSKNKFLIFFDIDGTLLVRQKPLDFKILRKLINFWKNKGIIFGINTNRPWSESARIYRVLQLNGPVIVENGSVYKMNAHSKQIKSNPRLIAIRIEISRILKRFAAENKKLGWVFKTGSKKNILKNKKIRKLIFMTNNRKYTASIYVRRRGVTDTRLLKKIYWFIVKELKKLFPQRIKIKTITGGKIIVFNANTERIKTMLQLRNSFYPRYNTLLISDAEDITKTSIKKISFGAVKNSRKDYKDLSHYKATKSGVAGLEQIIRGFINKK